MDVPTAAPTLSPAPTLTPVPTFAFQCDNEMCATDEDDDNAPDDCCAESPGCLGGSTPVIKDGHKCRVGREILGTHVKLGRSFGETSSRAARGFKSPRTRSSRRAGSRGRTTRTIMRRAAAAATGGVCNSLSYFVSLWVSALLPRLRLSSVFHTVGAASRPRRNPGRPGRRPGRWNWSPRLMRWRCRPRQAASSVPSRRRLASSNWAPRPPSSGHPRAARFIPPPPRALPANASTNVPHGGADDSRLQTLTGTFGSEPVSVRGSPRDGQTGVCRRGSPAAGRLHASNGGHRSGAVTTCTSNSQLARARACKSWTASAHGRTTRIELEGLESSSNRQNVPPRRARRLLRMGDHEQPPNEDGPSILPPSTMGVTVQGNMIGLEEGRSAPEGRGAHGPVRPA